MNAKRTSSLPWLRQAAHAYRGQMSLNICLGVTDVFLGLSEVWLTKHLVDAATAGQTWSFADGEWLSLPALSLLLGGCMLLSIAMVYAVRWLRATLGIRSRNALQAGEYARLLQSPWIYLRKQHSGALSNTLIEDVVTVSSFLSEQFPALITSVLQFVGAFAFLCVMDWRLAIVILVVTPALIVAAQRYIRLMRRYRHELRNEQADIQAYIQESLQHSLVLRALDRTSFASVLLSGHQGRMEQTFMRTTRYSASALVLVRFAFTAGYLIALFWGIRSLSLHLISFGAMVAFIQLVGQIQQPMRTLIGYVGTFVSVSTAAERLQALQSDQPSQPASPVATYSPDGSIRVQDVSYTYDDAQAPVLTHLSADIPTGSFVAVVGKTGIGKTTFVQLLLGLLRPQTGTIVQPQGGYAYVPQGNTLLSGTIRYNLLFGNPQATDDDMLAVLHLADADFVTDDPRGLDYPCGERGAGLSEGQAQRIAIARALLIQAPVLLLDEAFSALDTPTAQTILTNIRRARANLTIICVTHRDALPPLADKVIHLA